MEFLQVLIIGETDGIHKYQFALEKFIGKYPESDLQEYASQMLEVSRKYQEGLIQKRGASYLNTTDDKFLFVVIYEQANYKDDFSLMLKSFLDENFKDSKLNTANLILNEKLAMILINEFSTRQESMAFYGEINGNNSPFQDFESLNLNNFVITDDNFQILYQTKDLDGYLTFFEENFQ